MKKKIILIALLGVSLSSTSSECMWQWVKDNSFVVATGVLAACYIGYKWLRTPDKTKPTLDKLNVVTFMPQVEDDASAKMLTERAEENKYVRSFKKPIKIEHSESGRVSELLKYKFTASAFPDIPDNIANFKQITIFSRGGFQFTPGTPPPAAWYTMFVLQKAGVIRSDIPCIAFDYLDKTRTAINLGTTTDIDTLDLIVTKVLEKNPTIKINFVGICTGCMPILNYLVKNPLKNNLHSIILESPLSYFGQAFEERGYGFGPFVHQLCRLGFPNYNTSAPTIFKAKAFPNVPILISSIGNDDVSKPHHVAMLVRRLRHLECKNLYLYTTNEENAKHGKLGKDEGYQLIAQQFHFATDGKRIWDFAKDSFDQAKRAAETC